MISPPRPLSTEEVERLTTRDKPLNVEALRQFRTRVAMELEGLKRAVWAKENQLKGIDFALDTVSGKKLDRD